jgi:uncharacterized protein (DUF488 family)
MKLFTIGFTQKSAKTFFEILEKNKVGCVVDIRLHPDGQLAGFTKRNDLRYFLKELIHCDYRHIDRLAPTDEILKGYRLDKNWGLYESKFLSLLEQRGIPETLDRNLFKEKICCLLCSEPSSEKCHRRLVAEMLANNWIGTIVVHL